MKCNNYHSSYAFLNDKPISINDYIKKSKPTNIKCCHNHLLSFANNHFIHKFNNDIDENDIHSHWHKEWQSYFPYIEITYIRDDIRQIKTRRADIVLPKTKYNIEIQHSKISKIEVCQRKADYLIHNREIIWIINGSSEGILNIFVINENGNDNDNENENENDEIRFIIEFNDTNKWMYESFKSYEYIFIDYNNYIYKLNPKVVKNNMIDVIRLNRKIFIKNLQDGVFTIKKEVIKQSNLYIKQQGAGNGKTFGLIQNLKNKNFSHYDYFIIVSKQHSAKTIIYNEFISQLNNGNLNELELINDEKEHYADKKYQISFRNKITHKISHILISTIDSFMYKLGDKNNTHINKFEGIVKSLCDDCINEDFTNMTFIKYNANNFNLNKKLCLFIDETQDLSKDYGDAIIRIIKDKYIDAYIVGDALQSISIDNNAFVYLNSLNSLKNINIIKFNKVNIVRRFNSKQLIAIINDIIPFANYSLPPISSYCDNGNDNDNDDFEIIDGKKYKNYKSTEHNFDNINDNLDMIMEKYKYEVETNNYKPEDFLIITPFTSNNPLISILETRIQLYWLRKENPKEYRNYAIFHKSESGSSINLTESNNATRLVSIHTSKGDGRNIVFVIGLNKNSLLKFSKKPDNIIYDSLIHVALTRMKKKLYFFIDDEHDCIARKIKTILNNYYLRTSNKKAMKPNIFNISKFLKINKTVNDTYLKLLDLIINKTIYSNYLNLININNKVVDITHHYLRYASMRILLIIKTFKLDSDKHQIRAQILGIKNKTIFSVDNWKDYSNYFIKIDNNNDKYKTYDICLLELAKTTEYQKYFNIIQNFSYNIKSKIKTFAKYNYLCPYECMILNYILEFVKNGPYSNISIIELYNITNIYYKAYTPNILGHSNCKCNELFNYNNDNDNGNGNDNNNLHKYLLNHYEYINNVGVVYDKFLNDFPNVNWLLTHTIKYSGNTNEFILNKIFDFIGYDDNNVYIIYLKPQINELNYNEILLSSIIDTFIINSYNEGDDNDNDNEDDDNDYHNEGKNIINKNKERFKDKNIFTIIFSLNTDNYIKLDWGNLIKDNNNKLKKLFIEDIINTYINDEIYYYYRYFRNKYEDYKIIPEILKDINNNKNKETFPDFILTFFNNMKTIIIRYKKDTFENYDYIYYFNDKLKEVLKEQLYYYFNVEEY